MVAAFDELLTALDDMGPGDAVWERLYPAAFSDGDAADEFRLPFGPGKVGQRGSGRGERYGHTAAPQEDITGGTPLPQA